MTTGNDTPIEQGPANQEPQPDSRDGNEAQEFVNEK